MNSENFDLNLLRVFDVMMRERSVTRTAERLGRTQSAISHSLGRLRILFNDDLFTRDGLNMKPTPRAVEMLEEISLALTSIRQSIDRHLGFDPATSRRKFKIGLTDYHAMVLIPSLTQEFARQAPNAQLNVIPAINDDIADLVRFRKVDCLITGADVENFAELHRIELGLDRLYCAIWSGSSIAKKPLTMNEYLSAAHLQVSADGLSEGLADVALRDLSLSRNVVATISTYLALPSVLRGTEMITHCGDGILQILTDENEIALVPPPLSIQAVKTNLFLHRHMLTDPGTTWLRNMLAVIYDAAQITKSSILAERKLPAALPPVRRDKQGETRASIRMRTRGLGLS